jgi:hypothetical protein
MVRELGLGVVDDLKYSFLDMLPLDQGPALAREFIRHYPSGKTLTVHYSPNDPKRSQLEARKGSPVNLVWGLMLLAAGIVVARKSRR